MPAQMTNLPVSNILQTLPARTRRIAERQRRRGDLQSFFEIINDSLDSLIERKDRAAEIKREEEMLRQQQANTERTLGLAEDRFEYQKEQDRIQTGQADDLRVDTMRQQQEQEKVLRPMEDQYGQLSRRLISSQDPVERNQIAVDMMNLEPRIARFGGQVKPVQDILKTQQLLSPPEPVQPENPELEDVLDAIDEMSDAPNVDQRTRMDLMMLKARLRGGGVDAINDIYNDLSALRGGEAESKSSKDGLFAPVDVDRARKILLDEFSLSEKDVPPLALVDPRVFRQTVMAYVTSEAEDVDMSKAMQSADSLLSEYEVRPIVDGEPTTLERLLSSDFDADRPVPPDIELKRMAESMFSQSEIGLLLATQEGRIALDETLGYAGAATAIARLLGYPLEQEAFGALAR